MKKLLLSCSCALLLGGLGLRSASADTFSFNFSFPTDTGSVTFTASANGTPGQFLITGISGTLNGNAITGLLAPGAFPTLSAANDNILYSPASIPAVDAGQTVPSFLDTLGVSFVSGGQNWNLYFGSFAAVPTPATTGYNLLHTDQQTNDLLTSFTPAGPVTAATPEPGSLILLGTGVTGLAGVIRRRIARS